MQFPFEDDDHYSNGLFKLFAVSQTKSVATDAQILCYRNTSSKEKDTTAQYFVKLLQKIWVKKT